MSIRGGFDRLTKEIDALTYNSRSVLNALIRSTVTSGTSQGYTVTRVGTELTLSRVDIYRLYTFYQAWAANQFATTSGQTTSSGRLLLTFDQIRVEQDKTCVTNEDGTQVCTATTNALVTHSQILFLNSTTLGTSGSTVTGGQIVDTTESTNYWLGLLKDFNDPKLLTNSSPIPINLRTPVFDENMATTKYNNHPTYLFPYQYFGLQLLGYPGDDTEHFGGGKSWEWQLDEYVKFSTPAFSSGDVNSSSVYKTASERNHVINPQTSKPFEKTWSTVWGFDTHARSLYSTAGGRSSMVPRFATNSVAIGLRNLASDIQTTAIGGTINQATAQNSGVFAGQNNRTAGNASFATGLFNVTGGFTTDFTLPASDSSTECVPDTDACEARFETTGTQFGANQIAISGNIILPNVDGLGGFAIGDSVVLYAYTTYVSSTNESNNLYYSTNGDTFVSLNTTIVGMGYISDTTSLNFGKTIITLNDDLPNPSRIDGGRITRKSGVFGTNNTILSLGSGSSVFGNSNIASGVSQTVVGQFNRQSVVDTTNNYIAGAPQNFRLSRFVVGSGSSNENRQNTLEVYDGRLVVYASNNSVFGVPVVPSQYNGSQFRGFNVDDRTIKMIYDSTRVEVNPDGFILSKNTGTDNTIRIYTTGVGSSSVNQLRIENWTNPVVVQTGGNTALATGTGSIESGDIFLVSRNDVELSALDDVRLAANALVDITAGTDLRPSWNGDLILDGNTLGALPTTDKQYSHLSTGTTLSVNDYTRTGFYFLNANSYNGTAPDGIGDGVDEGIHLLTMAPGPDINNGNSLMQFAWAGPTTGPGDSISNVGRPAIRARDFNNATFDYSWRNLAYLQDLGSWIKDGGIVDNIVVVDNSGAPLFSRNGLSTWNPIIEIHFCVTASTAFFKIRLLGLRAGWDDDGQEKYIRIELNSNSGIGVFRNNIETDWAWDSENLADLSAPTFQGRFGARCIAGTRIIEIAGFQNNGDIANDIDSGTASGADSVALPNNMTFSLFNGWTDQ